MSDFWTGYFIALGLSTAMYPLISYYLDRWRMRRSGKCPACRRFW